MDGEDGRCWVWKVVSGKLFGLGHGHPMTYFAKWHDYGTIPKGGTIQKVDGIFLIHKGYDRFSTMLSYHYAFMDLFSEVCRLWGRRVKNLGGCLLASLRSFIEIYQWPSRLSRLCCNSFGFVPSMTFLSHTWAIITLLTWNIQTSNTIHLYTIRIATSHYHDTYSILLTIVT